MRNSMVRWCRNKTVYPFQRTDGSISFLTSQLQLRPLAFCKVNNLFLSVRNYTCQLPNACHCTVSFKCDSSYEPDRILQTSLQGDIFAEELQCSSNQQLTYVMTIQLITESTCPTAASRPLRKDHNIPVGQFARKANFHAFQFRSRRH
jgi:hypothetical protein